MFGRNGFAQPSPAVCTRSFAAGATARAWSPAVTTLPLDAQTRSRRRGLRPARSVAWGRVGPTVGSGAHTHGARASARFLECVTTRWHRLLPSLRLADMTAEPRRIDYATVFPAGVQAMGGLQRAVDTAGIEPLLLELVKMRASQINGCAY